MGMASGQMAALLSVSDLINARHRTSTRWTKVLNPKKESIFLDVVLYRKCWFYSEMVAQEIASPPPGSATVLWFRNYLWFIRWCFKHVLPPSFFRRTNSLWAWPETTSQSNDDDLCIWQYYFRQCLQQNDIDFRIGKQWTHWLMPVLRYTYVCCMYIPAPVHGHPEKGLIECGDIRFVIHVPQHITCKSSQVHKIS